MTISINTSEYIKYKKVEIDGVELGLRMMSSAETLELTALQRDSKKPEADGVKIMERLMEIFMELFDKPEQARELLKNLSVDALADIYQKVMTEG